MLMSSPPGRAEGVQLLPGSAFATASARVQGARLGFASLDPAELRKATHRLRVAFGSYGDCPIESLRSERVAPLGFGRRRFRSLPPTADFLPGPRVIRPEPPQLRGNPVCT